MRNPEYVLNSLISKNKDSTYKFTKLYKNLYNSEFFLLAYQNLYAKEGNMTEGTDGKNIDAFSVNRIEKLIEKLREETYQPVAVKRVFIPKSNGKKRGLGIPSFDDKLVQEIIRMILEAIYDKTFSKQSHGFRAKKSCHTALLDIKDNFNGVRWWVEGDIEGFFDNINHNILITQLRKRIKDEKWIRLIWKFLRAGYMKDQKFHRTYSGTPQGGIISPILSNIYLDELDKYIEEYKKSFNTGKQRSRNKEYRNLEYQINKTKKNYKKLWDNMTEIERKKSAKTVKNLKQQMRNTPCTEIFDEKYKRIQYVRYADDFLIGIIGNKKEAEKIKIDLTKFLKEKLYLKLSKEKTLITHSKKPARFLGYDVSIRRSNEVKKDSLRKIRRVYNLTVKLSMPKEKWVSALLKQGSMKITGKNRWKTLHRQRLVDSDDLEILSVYNAEIRGLYNYYKLAFNVHSLSHYKNIMKHSMLKTFSSKYRTTSSKMRKKFNIEGNIGVKYKTKDGEKVSFFYKDGFKKQLDSRNLKVDLQPNISPYFSSRNSIIKRLCANKCEWCHTEIGKFEVHHVRKLKDLKGKKLWEQNMLARRRKTIVLCIKCHDDLHAGRLDG